MCLNCCVYISNLNDLGWKGKSELRSVIVRNEGLLEFILPISRVSTEQQPAEFSVRARAVHSAL
jgi:hypothetical protein